MARGREPHRAILPTYWRMEAGNVVFVPGLALFFGFPADANRGARDRRSRSSATAGFLVVGTLFWRGVDRRLSMRRSRRARRAPWPSPIASKSRSWRRPLGALVATLIALAMNGWTYAVIAATLLTLLAVLEYVNYYHRQLQHFDNRADFMRLVTGRGVEALAHGARPRRVAARAYGAAERRGLMRVSDSPVTSASPAACRACSSAPGPGAGARARGRRLGAQLRRRVGRGALSGERGSGGAADRRGCGAARRGRRWRGSRRAKWPPRRATGSRSGASFLPSLAGRGSRGGSNA